MAQHHHRANDLDFSAMDMFNGFGMPAVPTTYNGSKAPETGNTSSELFNLDGGIDTTSGAGMFGQQSFDSMFSATNNSTGFGMQPLTLDNTSGSGSWGNANTNAMTSFPPTPAQSFGAMFTPSYSNAFGKRPLQLDVQDFPRPKRHETTGDFALSPFPSSASVSGSSWATPSSSTEVGLSDEAADVCATWFSKYNVLPSDRHIDSLSQLTGESATAIRHWFGQALKQGMHGHDSAYKSQTSFTDPILYPVSQGPSEVITQPMIPDLPCNPDAQATTTTQSPLRGGKKGCNPTDDPELLKRDPNKIYQCTRKCGKRYGRKCDWKRNEEEGYPSKSWICSLCISQGVERVKPCFRKYHFSQHFRNIHPGLNCSDYEEASMVHSDTAFPRKCGFCPHRFESRQDRIDHLAEHFKQGKCMLDWNDDNDNHDSDSHDDDDDNDNHPDGDSGGFDNSKPFFPPGNDQQRGSGSKFNGNSGSGSGFGGQQLLQSGYFQFQLARFNDTDTRGASPGTSQHINSASGKEPNDQCLRITTESGVQCCGEPGEQCSMHGRHEAAEGYNSKALARDAVTESLIQPQGKEKSLYQAKNDSLSLTDIVIADATASRDSSGMGPLLAAVKNGNLEVAKLLLNYGLDVPAVDLRSSALHRAAAGHHPDVSAAESSLLEVDSPTDGMKTAKLLNTIDSAQGSLSLLPLNLLQAQSEASAKEEYHETMHGPDQYLDTISGADTRGLIARMLSHLGLRSEDTLTAYKVLCGGLIGHHDRHGDKLNERLSAILSSAAHPPPPPPLLPPPLLATMDGEASDCDQLQDFARKDGKEQNTLTLSSLLSGLHSQELSVLQSSISKVSAPWLTSEHSLLVGAIAETGSDVPFVSEKLAQRLTIPIGASLQDYWKGLTTLLDSQSFLSVKLLGTGGFSTVDEVVHRETSLRISRKTLKNREQSAMNELKKEVNVLQKLRHPHIIRFLGAYSKGDKMSILLSPVAETTLALWLDRNILNRPAGLSQTIVQMLGCLSSSIRYLHEQRPVVKHMDIKPQNILVMQGNQDFPHVVLSDFGISSFEETTPDGKSTPLTRQYCAPEVPEGTSRGQAADIWSLGCVFAEMATVAFSEDNPHWLEFRQRFRCRDGKYYWQDVPALQDWLRQFLEEAKSLKETTVVRMVKSMLNSEPNERPDASLLTMVFTPAPCCLSWPNEKASYPGPMEELRTVEMLIHEDGVNCSAQSHLHGGIDDKQLCESFEHAKSWLDECSHDHEACRGQRSDTKVLPTRLLDVRPDGVDGLSVRIVDGAQLVPSSGETNYVALSYVWSRDEFTLSTDNLQLARAELPRETLPKAVDEAISAAQRIGYRYIWVDSLCVLQDSDEDKERECLATADVYRNAALTIVLDQLNSIPRDQVKTEPDSSSGNTKYSPWSIGGLHGGVQLLTPSAALPAIDFITPGFAWDTRAWSLQERLLSRRLLHLGEEQMYWECNALKASETFPHGLPPLLWEKVHTRPSADPNAQLQHVKCEYEPSACAKKVACDEHERNVHAASPRLLRSCQWIKKEGDGSWDAVQAVQRKVEHSMSEKIDAVDNVKSKILDERRSSKYEPSSSNARLNSQTTHSSRNAIKKEQPQFTSPPATDPRVMASPPVWARSAPLLRVLSLPSVPAVLPRRMPTPGSTTSSCTKDLQTVFEALSSFTKQDHHLDSPQAHCNNCTTHDHNFDSSNHLSCDTCAADLPTVASSRLEGSDRQLGLSAGNVGIDLRTRNQIANENENEIGIEDGNVLVLGNGVEDIVMKVDGEDDGAMDIA